MRGDAAPPPPAQPEVRLVNRVLPGDVKLFPQEAGPEGCASGECLPEPKPEPAAAAVAKATPAPLPDLAEPDEADEPPEPPPPAARAAPRATGPATDEEKWRRAVDAVRQASPRHGKSLSYARFLGFVPEGVRVAFSPDDQFHKMQVSGMNRPMIEAEFTRVLGRPIKLIEDTNAAALVGAPRSIAEVEQTDRNTRERSIEDKVKHHPALRNIVRHLGGTLEHITYLEAPTRQPDLSSPDEGDAGPPVD